VSSWIVPWLATRPCTRIATRSHTISSSDSRCEFRKIVFPSAFIRVTISRMSRRPTGSTPSVGSSSTTSSGSLISACAIPIRCLIPLEYPFTRTFSHRLIPTISSSAPRRRRRSPRGTPLIAP
jgi:hypothetical protein